MHTHVTRRSNMDVLHYNMFFIKYFQCRQKIRKRNTLTASTGSEEPRGLANDMHNPSTSERVFTVDIASCGFIPSFIPSTI